MLNILPIPATDIISYMNIAFIVIIVLCGIIGFCRGLLKSSFCAITTLLVFVIGWLLMGPIVNKLIYMDLSSYNIDFDGMQVTSVMDVIKQSVLADNPDYAFLFTEGSNALALMEGVAGLVFRIVYIIILIILSFTVFRLINWIIWLCVRNPLRRKLCKTDEVKKNGKPKYRKKISSRLYGLGIGLTKGLLYTLLLGFILAGLASVSDSLKEITAEENEMAVVYTGDSFTLVELEAKDEFEEDKEDNKKSESPLAEYEDLLEVFSGYRDTVPGKVFGCIKFGKNKTTFDEALFDSIFKIKGENGSIKVRSELKKLARALNNEAVQEIMTDGFDIAKLHQLSDEDLKALIDTIAELDLVKVIVPVGLEFIAYSDMIESADIKNLVQEKLPELLKIDYCEEVKSLGYVFIDVVDLLGEDIEDLSNLDFFSFDQETLNSIFDGLGEMKLLEVVAPVTINYLINSESVKEAIESTGFTLDDLGLTEDVDYVAELMNLPKIYEKIVDLGIKYVDGEVSLDDIDPDKVEGFVDTLFTSTIIKNAVPVVASTLTTTYLPEDYKGILPEEELKSVNWENEFKPLLTAVAVLLKTDILNSEDPMQTLIEMDDKTFADLGKYMSKSELLTNNMNELLDVLLKALQFENVTFQGLDSSKGEVWNETEIVALFTSIKKIVSTLDSKMTDEQIEDLAESIASSKYIKKNLNNLINGLTSDIGFELATLADDEWTVNEIFAVFKSINIISEMSSSGSIKVEDFLKLSDDKLSTVLESKLIKLSLKKIIVEKSQPGGDLDLLKGVYEDGIDANGNKVYEWDDTLVDVASTVSGSKLIITPNNQVVRYNIYKNGRFFKSTVSEFEVNLNSETYTYNSSDKFTVKGIVKNGELRNTFNAISALEINDISSFNIDLKNVVKNKDTLLSSYILTETIIEEIKSYDKDLNPTSVLIIPEELKDGGSGDWHGEYGELNNLIEALDKLLALSTSNEPVYITQLTNKINNVYIENLNSDIDTILISDILTLTVIEEIRKLNDSGLKIPAEYLSSNSNWGNEYTSDNQLVKQGEIARFIQGVYVAYDLNENTQTPVNGIDVNNIPLGHIVNDHVIDDILYSDILNLTIKNKVLSYAEGVNPTLYLPEDYDVVGAKNYIVWENTYDSHGVVTSHGELNHFFEGLHYLLGSHATMEDLDQLSYEQIFETKVGSENVVPQDEILKSKVISETIIMKIVNENAGTIIVPSNVGLDNPKDRTKWFNTYNSIDQLSQRKELANLINSLGEMLTEDQKHDLNNIDLYDTIDNVVNKFNNDKSRETILSSYVICETLKDNLNDIDALKDSNGVSYITKAFTNNNKSLNSSSEWYAFDSNGKPLQKELWNLLTGISLLMGNKSIKNLDEFTIDVLVENEEMIPAYNSNCEITSSNIGTMLNSIVLEEIFASVAKEICDNGYLKLVINVPSNVNWYKRDVSGSEEYDLKTFLETFYLINDLLDYSTNKDILKSADKLKTLTNDEIDRLATGMVVSRIFRGSIEKMFNAIFAPAYALKYLSNPSIKSWDSIKFVQSDYDNNTKVQAKAKFITTYKGIITELNK